MELSARLAELRRLGEKAIVTPDTTANLAREHAFVVNTLLANAEQLLSAWFMVQREYGPLLNALAIPMARAQSLLQQPEPVPAPATPA